MIYINFMTKSNIHEGFYLIILIKQTYCNKYLDYSDIFTTKYSIYEDEPHHQYYHRII